MRTGLLIPVLAVLARAPQLGALMVAGGLAGIVGPGGMPLGSGLALLAIAALGVMEVGLALALPSLVYASGLAGDPLGAAGLLGASLTAGFWLAVGTWSTGAGQAADAVLAGRWDAAGRIWAAHLGLGLFAAAAGWGLGLGARLLVA